MIKILLHGLSCPIDGQQFPDVIPAMGGNDDEWIASVISYIRNDMDNKAPVVRAEEVRRIRQATSGRKLPWTTEELAE